jgi:predicted NUDIX family NTP pyrophosphohydrolase
VARESAGLLLFRRAAQGLEVLLVHPGGPLWARRDAGAWSIPKGEVEPGEDALAAARREVEEETGLRAAGPFLPLGAVRQRGGKRVAAWAVEGEFDPAALRSGRFEMEWPPRSGRRQSFPEVDRAAWFGLPEARRRILDGQRPLLDALEAAAGR